MSKILSLGVRLIASVMAMTFCFGSGQALAINEYAGDTYAKIVERIQRDGGKPVITYRLGDYLPTDECLVTSSGHIHDGLVPLNLNCTDTKSDGHPGYSAATPIGKQAKEQQRQLQAALNYINGKPSYCIDRAEECQKICDESAKCSDEVLQYLS